MLHAGKLFDDCMIERRLGAHATGAHDLRAIVLRASASGRPARADPLGFLQTYVGDGIAWTAAGELTSRVWLYRRSKFP
ncbi:hypothetical protein [Nocardia aurantiaca]|uniref:Uncharacterized protein n=1 Tax=Nocardia aurantiaca TaxID=2675850 RepID=A0A6I3KXW8_9NOCA|nr:hypothetical protein [Nocardia aurantiaca]MTE13466.1 hypothetical protein [Nocardia aurantiaca]